MTDSAFSKARIQSINKERIFEQLDAGKIVIVAGFQGVTPEGDYTTLGRGGSNATLVAIGAVLKADVCENYTDVDGIFTADPRIVHNARKIDRISYDEMLELAGLGASVLQTRAVEFAKKYNVPIHVRNSQNENEGTWIVAETPNMEHIVVSGAALKKDLTRVTIKNVPDRPGIAAKIFGDIAAANIVVDDIIQNVMDDNTANISFTVEHGDLPDIKPVVDRLVKDLGQGAGHLPGRPGQGERRRRRHARPHRRRPADVQGAGRRGDQHPEHHDQRDQDLLHHRQGERPEGAADRPRRVRVGEAARGGGMTVDEMRKGSALFV